MLVPRAEIDRRHAALRQRLAAAVPDWRLAAIVGKVNLYYLTGTMQNGVLLLPRDGEAVLWVRRSHSRAVAESPLPDIRPMASFRDLTSAGLAAAPTVLVETEVLTLAHYQRFNKYLGFAEFAPLDPHLAAVRAVKSPFELERMRASGQIHRQVLEDELPAMLRPGLSEVELAATILHRLLDLGHHGIARIAMFDTELFMGGVCFGENSLAENAFDGPDGIVGMDPAVPLFGSRQRRLAAGDLVFVDVGCGVDGYHTDKSMVYFFQATPSPAVQAIHDRCLQIQNQAAEQLRPGTIPARLYEQLVDGLEPEFRQHFMGFGGQGVRFLGHGIGLHIDEYPAIAKGFEQPLEENMTIALEPKRGIPGVGLVGTENTFQVTPEGGRSLTGSSPGLITVD